MDVTFSIFPKFYRHLNVPQLAGLIREAGLDTTNVVIRDGYWVTPSGLAAELPAFVKAMSKGGIRVYYATAGFDAARLADDPTPLKVLADNGITDFRLDYFRAQENVRASLALVRRHLERLVPLCQRHKVRALYQLHHGTLIPNPSAAWHLLNGLPASSIGIKLDPGNQSFEGFEDWGRSARLLGEYVAAVGVKDTALIRDPACANEPGKGWHREWVPIDEGVTNWHQVVKALMSIDFSGSFVFMPFYDEDDPAAMTEKLKREVLYLRRVIAAIREIREI